MTGVVFKDGANIKLDVVQSGKNGFKNLVYYFDMESQKVKDKIVLVEIK